MREYNLDLYGEEISDPITYLAIKEVIHTEQYQGWRSLLLLSDLVSKIKGNHLLDPVLKLLEQSGLLNNREEFEEKLLLACNGKPYSRDDFSKIRAIAFSDLIAREIYHRRTSGGTAELLVNIYERQVYTNIDEIEEEIKRKSYSEFTERNENLPIPERETELKAILTSFAKHKYEHQTSFFDNEINYFTLLKENLPSENLLKQSTRKTGKPGRKKSTVKPITEYFTGYDKPTTVKYLNALKEHFKGCSNRKFVFLIKGLKEAGDIQFTTRKEIYCAFEDFLKNPPTSTQSKNDHFNARDPELKTEISSSIQTIKEENLIF